MAEVTEAFFESTLKIQLGKQWDGALRLFRNYGPGLAWDVTNVLLHASEQGKINEVLEILEKHWWEHLMYQHPEIRGTFMGFSGNSTDQMFLELCRKTLGLKPA